MRTTTIRFTMLERDDRGEWTKRVSTNLDELDDVHQMGEVRYALEDGGHPLGRFAEELSDKLLGKVTGEGWSLEEALLCAYRAVAIASAGCVLDHAEVIDFALH